ncbi:shikimate kinase [Paucibacter sp. APW11]|uniref:Shikimate kinase n=1 Tax=Roseateles aquae TaxID=3077235 RepID=A0ABU3PJD2_9BURK|nr:shikimate kinase [Paucibacter sp. APW11]MDT9002146.1 shikimate kinase [Paucibacter sp. APW11]
MKVALVGMPGGGKSSVGRGLARQLGLGFADSDSLIEQRIGGTIRQFFDEHGEDAFRSLEQQAITDLLTQPGDAVIATGGGAVLRPSNRAALRAGATVVYLHSSPEELFRRLRHDTQRPLLQVADPLRKLRELYAQRDPAYRQCAHFVLETGRPSVASLVNMVAMQLELAGVMDGRSGQSAPLNTAN